MPPFAYRAVDLRGIKLVGTLDAPTPAALTQVLEAQGLVVVDVASASSDASARGAFGRTSRAAVVDVTRALAGLLSAGLPLSRALTAAASVSRGPVADRLTAVRERVARGDSLATALAAHPDLFSPLYIGLVRAGERSGDLEGTFTRLATQLEWIQRMFQRQCNGICPRHSRVEKTCGCFRGTTMTSEVRSRCRSSMGIGWILLGSPLASCQRITS